MDITVTAGISAYDQTTQDRQAIGPKQVKVTQSGQGDDGGIRDIGTTEEVVTFTDITTNGLLYLENLDPTNYVQFGPTSGGAMVVQGRLNPKDPPAIFRLEPGAVLRLKANVAACKVRIRIWNA